jgi:hypothetical protein
MIYFVCWARRVHKQYNKARQINTTYTANFSHAPHRKIRSCIRQSQSREDSARVVIWSGYPLNFQAAVSPQGLLARRASLANPSIHDAQRRCLPGRLTRRRSSTRVPNVGMFDFSKHASRLQRQAMQLDSTFVCQLTSRTDTILDEILGRSTSELDGSNDIGSVLLRSRT